METFGEMENYLQTVKEYVCILKTNILEIYCFILSMDSDPLVNVTGDGSKVWYCKCDWIVWKKI